MPTALVDSRLGPGTLKLGATDYGIQVSNVKLTPDHNQEDGTPTLGKPDPAPLLTTTWTLEGEAIQDWEAADGFVSFAVANNNTEVAFEWEPKNGGPTFAGNCLVTAVEYGGDVNSQNTTSFSFAVIGAVTRTPAVQLAAKAAGTTR